mmetsp:Transcript_54686/g.123028  ORF Transcript_54686/g.123028 Transcript_54686/m.123028 type:complete len:216 (+) Transcript_54686:93-740(+)
MRCELRSQCCHLRRPECPLQGREGLQWPRGCSFLQAPSLHARSVAVPAWAEADGVSCAGEVPTGCLRAGTLAECLACVEPRERRWRRLQRRVHDCARRWPAQGRGCTLGPAAARRGWSSGARRTRHAGRPRHVGPRAGHVGGVLRRPLDGLQCSLQGLHLVGHKGHLRHLAKHVGLHGCLHSHAGQVLGELVAPVLHALDSDNVLIPGLCFLLAL